MVTLQYMAFNRFETMRCPDTGQAITTAIEMARKQLGQPLRILTENGAVAVSERALAQQISFALDGPDEKVSWREVDYAIRKRERAALEAERQAELEATPGYGTF